MDKTGAGRRFARSAAPMIAAAVLVAGCTAYAPGQQNMPYGYYHVQPSAGYAPPQQSPATSNVPDNYYYAPQLPLSSSSPAPGAAAGTTPASVARGIDWSGFVKPGGPSAPPAPAPSPFSLVSPAEAATTGAPSAPAGSINCGWWRLCNLWSGS